MSDEKTNTETKNELEEAAGASAPSSKELIVLGCYNKLFLCREKCLNGRLVTFKTKNKDGIPGSIITVTSVEETKGEKYPEISGTITSVCYSAKDLDLEPIPVVKCGKWSPKDECYGKDGEPTPDWFRSLAKKGKRMSFAFEPTAPFGDPFGMAAAMKMSEDFQPSNFFRAPGTAFGPPDTNPVNKATNLFKSGSIKAARKILMDLLVEDLRCLDAHNLLGEIEVDKNPKKALLHYQMGVSIGQLSLKKEAPDPVVAWGYLENRPYLRCFYGTGICAWKMGNLRLVKEIFLQLLSMNPRDNQGIRGMLPFIARGRTWDDYRVEHLLQGNMFEGTMGYHVFRMM